jgi:hypothetical protein
MIAVHPHDVKGIQQWSERDGWAKTIQQLLQRKQMEIAERDI